MEVFTSLERPTSAVLRFCCFLVVCGSASAGGLGQKIPGGMLRPMPLPLVTLPVNEGPIKLKGVPVEKRARPINYNFVGESSKKCKDGT